MSPQTAQADVQDFSISNFTADYYLSRSDSRSSQLQVTESITAVFPNFDQNHGILRFIPETYQDHTVDLKIDSVTSPTGRPWRYSVSHQKDNALLRIGDPDRFVHGQQTFIIKYRLSNVTLLLADHDEFYWDINGNAWPQAMGKVTARIHIPQDLRNSLQDRQECFTGLLGSKEQNCTITRQVTNGETIVAASAVDVGPNQTLTTVLGFNQGTFVLGPEIAAAKRRQAIILFLKISPLILLPLATVGVMYGRWRKYGRDPEGRGVIIPQYEPPAGFNVLSSAFVLNEKLPPTAVTAAVIELAVQRYVDISEIKTKKLIRTSTDYELTLVKDYKSLSPEHQRVITAFFGPGAEVGNKVKLGSLKNKLYTDVAAIDKMLETDLTARNYFRGLPSKARRKHFGWAALLFIVGFVISYTGVLLFAGLGLIASSLIITAFSNLMPARSDKGVEARDHLLGVKEFIKVVEEKRFEYLQSPEGAEKTGFHVDAKSTVQKVKLFESLLPYAMIFGLEKGWAKEFEDIYPETPEWYHGNYSTFRTAYLVSAISGISSSSTQALSAPSSSGSSGFGGGGFSGGGGGGGGGGGW